MWRRGTFACLMARSPIQLRDAGRPTKRSTRGTSSGERHEQAKGNAAPTTGSTTQPRPSPPMETALDERAGAGVASSTSTSLSSLMTAVEHLKETTRRTQHTVRHQEDALQLLQQKVLLVERQAGQLESTAEGLRGRLNEVHRVVGEMMMGQRNTDLLIQQMERQHLSAAQPTPGASEQHEARTVDGNTGESSLKSEASTTDDASAPLDASLVRRLAVLEARVSQLTMELFAADRLSAVVSGRSNQQPARHPNVEDLAAVLSSSDSLAKRVVLMRELQRRHAISAFTDAVGVTRVTSQCVRLHNIPLNMGAIEVREICVQHVCQGDSSGLVSCMVRRSPDVVYGDNTAPRSPSSSKEHGGPEGSPVYRSQQQQKPQPTAASTAAREASSKMKEREAAAAEVGALPRGDAVAASQPSTKSFEVVFASSALAVQALTVLNGLLLRPTVHTGAVPLAVEPVVSADVLAALREIEDATHGAAQRE